MFCTGQKLHFMVNLKTLWIYKINQESKLILFAIVNSTKLVSNIFPTMAVHLSTGLYLFVAIKKYELTLFNCLSKKLQSSREVTATASLAIPAKSPNSETTLLSITKLIYHDTRGFWYKTMGTPRNKNMLIRKALISRSMEAAESQLDNLLTVILAKSSIYFSVHS